jgi:hypothetical protein
MTPFTFESDPAHGWLLVTANDLQTAGLTEQDISAFSFISPNRAQIALEEDLDAQTFLNAWTAKTGASADIRDKYVARTPIRNWPSFGTKPFDPPCFERAADFDQAQTAAQVAEEERQHAAHAMQMQERAYHSQDNGE